MRVFVIAIVIGTSALVATRELSAQRGGGQPLDAASIRAANNRFAGVWKLVSEETRNATGDVVRRGPDGGRVGYIAYDAAGYMGVVLAFSTGRRLRSVRPRLRRRSRRCVRITRTGDRSPWTNPTVP